MGSLVSAYGKATGTLGNYRRALRAFTAWLTQLPSNHTSFHPDDFTRTAFHIYMSELEKAGDSPSHRTLVKAAVNDFARGLIEEQGRLQRNPTPGVEIEAQPRADRGQAQAHWGLKVSTVALLSLQDIPASRLTDSVLHGGRERLASAS